MDPLKISTVKHLYEVEHLTIRQIAKELRMCTKTISLIIKEKQRPKKRKKPTNLAPYLRLIDEWYARHPSLKATQVYARLKDYGYTGKYSMVSAYTMHFRKKKNIAYHELEFLPGQCAQVDWMVAHLSFGKVYGFVFILAWSRYLFVMFYPRSSMEFFLDGHIKASTEMKGAARENWYDNLKSVVTSRKPEITFNTQFVDYMSHMGVAIHACNPGKGNEKGRVERVIRDIRHFIEVHDFVDLKDLNTQMDRWRKEWNERVHRTTHRIPVAALIEEKLLPLPVIPYRPYRIVLASIGKTAFVEFDTNRYSVPTDYAGMAATICAYPEYIEILVYGRKIARHERSFGRHEKIELPSHRERLLERTPHGKYARIYHLMRRMGKEIDHFLTMVESEGEDRLNCAYGLFRLLLGSSKEMLLSAVREANTLRIYKLHYLWRLLEPPGVRSMAVYPQNASLLAIAYEKRELTDYDHLA
jgi:transposase